MKIACHVLGWFGMRKRDPVYETKMKRIRLDIVSVEMLGAGPEIDEAPVDLSRNYQSYPAPEPPRQRG